MIDPSFLHLADRFWTHDLWHPLNGNGYQFWSGIGSDISEVTLIGMGIGFLKHKNCRRKGCWRLGHPHPETGQPVCHRHARQG